MDSVLLGFVGDLMVDRDRPADPFHAAREVLSVPDILFGNLEAAFTDNPHPAPSGATPLFPRASNLDVFPEVGFDVLSMANNHIVDAGHEAMLENRARLRSKGVATCGAGANLTEAREPAIVVRNGIRVAVLGYASVFPMGYEARSNVPGLVPLRAYDFWRCAVDNYHAPGTPPRAQTIPDDGDLARAADDIAKARALSDLVVFSVHWGDFLRPYHLTDHETRTAKWAIDQGADIVVGHHHHALRGAEWYRGKPIFYGLGHFVFDLKLQLSAEATAMFAELRKVAGDYAVFPREGWPLLPMHPDTRMTVLAWAQATASGVTEIGILPCMLRPDGSVEPVDATSDEGLAVAEYLKRCNETQTLDGLITTDGAPRLAGFQTLRIVDPKMAAFPASEAELRVGEKA